MRPGVFWKARYGTEAREVGGHLDRIASYAIEEQSGKYGEVQSRSKKNRERKTIEETEIKGETGKGEVLKKRKRNDSKPRPDRERAIG